MCGPCSLIDKAIRERPPGSVLERNKELPYHLEKLLRSWLRKAVTPFQKENEELGDYFQAFIYLWIAFNAWLLHVASDDIGDVDKNLINAAAHDTEFNQKFEDLKESNSDFNLLVNEFSDLWPVFRVKDLIRENIDGWQQYNIHETREEYREEIFARNERNIKENKKGIRYEPKCYLEHHPNKPPADWAHNLLAIYQIRCNLFHGGKSLLESRDREFVRYAYRILWYVWGVLCFKAQSRGEIGQVYDRNSRSGIKC